MRGEVGRVFCSASVLLLAPLQSSSYATVVTTRTFWNGVFAPLESQ
ncbi:hypothetical protein FHR91_000504 [Erythrobacter lutimaris]|nr:hypothetical protein [Alteriqipengyuania lutimaris]